MNRTALNWHQMNSVSVKLIQKHNVDRVCDLLHSRIARYGSLFLPCRKKIKSQLWLSHSCKFAILRKKPELTDKKPQLPLFLFGGVNKLPWQGLSVCLVFFVSIIDYVISTSIISHSSALVKSYYSNSQYSFIITHPKNMIYRFCRIVRVILHINSTCSILLSPLCQF